MTVKTKHERKRNPVVNTKKRDFQPLSRPLSLHDNGKAKQFITMDNDRLQLSKAISDQVTAVTGTQPYVVFLQAKDTSSSQIMLSFYQEQVQYSVRANRNNSGALRIISAGMVRTIAQMMGLHRPYSRHFTALDFDKTDYGCDVVIDLSITAEGAN